MGDLSIKRGGTRLFNIQLSKAQCMACLLIICLFYLVIIGGQGQYMRWNNGRLLEDTYDSIDEIVILAEETTDSDHVPMSDASTIASSSIVATTSDFIASTDITTPDVPAADILDPSGLIMPKPLEGSYGLYTVSNGDSLYLIAETYSTTIEKLKYLSGLTSDIIPPGLSIVVPLHSLREYPNGVRLTDKELEWVAQMVHAEARGEPYLGQVAVATVILNRVKSPKFPNTVRGVLFQPNAFQPVRNGTFFRPANDMAHRATLEALYGHDPTNGALFFFNPRISTDRFMHARPAVVTIGEHRFMH